MKKTVALDSQIIIWGIKRIASVGQEENIPKAAALIKQLEKEGCTIIIPMPVIGEILTPVPLSDHAGLLSIISKNIQIIPFDIPAAAKFAEMMQSFKGDEELKKYRLEAIIPREVVKVDYMIAAIAVSRKCDRIYSNDKGLAKFASGFIEVKSL